MELWCCYRFELKNIGLNGHQKQVTAVDFDMEFIISGSDDKTIKIWNCQDYSLMKTLEGHRGAVSCLQYKAPLIISGSWNAVVYNNSPYRHCIPH